MSTSLSEKEITLIKNTWGFVITNNETAGEMFYSKLFETAPAVRPLFKADISEQASKLISMVTIIVAKLNKLDEVVKEVDFLARKHIKYGAKPAHYAAVGQALLWTLEQGLSKQWTPEVEEAWTKVYGILSEGMITSQKIHSA